MKEVVLIGNPNTGKTTLFNTLTKSNERASNWHGVTVGVRSKVSKIFKENILVTDLPGIYSLGGYFSEEKIAIRAGHHCAQPLQQYLQINASARASLYFYNTEAEIDVFLDKLSQLRKWSGYKD